MKITLKKLVIENFKGIRAFTFEPGGEDVTVCAENGVGKTTVYDAFLWLLFDKNAQGKAKFANRPLDGNNESIKGLDVKVVATLAIDGESHCFQRIEKEHAVKKQIRGFTSSYEIDEVPKSQTKYQSYIAEVIDEDIFKMLTDLQAFNNLHWTDRRTILLDIAGPAIGTPSGFTELTSKLKGRSMADYKKVLADQKKAHEKERDEINPRLDEIHKRLEAIGDAAGDLKAAGDTRVQAIKEKAELTEQKKKLLLAQQT